MNKSEFVAYAQVSKPLVRVEIPEPPEIEKVRLEEMERVRKVNE